MRRDSDDAAPRCMGVAIVVLLHAAALTVLLNVEALRRTVKKTAPVFVSLIASQQPRTQEPPTPVSQKSATKRAPSRRSRGCVGVCFSDGGRRTCTGTCADRISRCSTAGTCDFLSTRGAGRNGAEGDFER